MATLVIRDGSQRGYLNSVQQFSDTLPYTFSTNTIGLFGEDTNRIGHPLINMLHIDEVGIWNRELTNGEIFSLYNDGAGLSFNVPEPSSLVGLVLGAGALASRRKRD